MECFLGVINSFVHIIMYTYYMMAAMGPEYQKYLWWKSYITNIQMVRWKKEIFSKTFPIQKFQNFQIQFGMAFLHSAQLLWTDCGYPRWSVCFTLPNAIFFYMLFNDFYHKSYKGKRLAAAKLANGKANGTANGHANGDINHNHVECKDKEFKKDN